MAQEKKTFSGNRFTAQQFEESLKKGQALYKVEKAKACKVSEDLITVPIWTFNQAKTYFSNMSSANRRQKFAVNLNTKQKQLKQMRDENKFSENNQAHLKLALQVRCLEHLNDAIGGFIASRAGGGADSSPEGKQIIKKQDKSFEEKLHDRQKKQKSDGQNARKRHLQTADDAHEEEKKRKRAFAAAKLNMEQSQHQFQQDHANLRHLHMLRQQDSCQAYNSRAVAVDCARHVVSNPTRYTTEQVAKADSVIFDAMIAASSAPADNFAETFQQQATSLDDQHALTHTSLVQSIADCSTSPLRITEPEPDEPSESDTPPQRSTDPSQISPAGAGLSLLFDGAPFDGVAGDRKWTEEGVGWTSPNEAAQAVLTIAESNKWNSVQVSDEKLEFSASDIGKRIVRNDSLTLQPRDEWFLCEILEYDLDMKEHKVCFLVRKPNDEPETAYLELRRGEHEEEEGDEYKILER